MVSNTAAIVTIIKYVICLIKAKFTDKANVEIALKRKSTEKQRPFSVMVLWGFSRQT